MLRNSGTIAISPADKAEFLRELGDRVQGYREEGIAVCVCVAAAVSLGHRAS
jgi:hypothetical protein